VGAAHLAWLPKVEAVEVLAQRVCAVVPMVHTIGVHDGHQLELYEAYGEEGEDRGPCRARW